MSTFKEKLRKQYEGADRNQWKTGLDFYEAGARAVLLLAAESVQPNGKGGASLNEDALHAALIASAKLLRRMAKEIE
jgi:hypothetical protein